MDGIAGRLHLPETDASRITASSDAISLLCRQDDSPKIRNAFIALEPPPPAPSLRLLLRTTPLLLALTGALIGCQQTAPTVVPAPPELLAASPGYPAGPGAYTAAPIGAAGPLPPPVIPAAGGTPIHANVTNREWAWEAIVDKVDDYFRIEREQQVQLVGDILTEGRIDTFPQIGATVIEPQRVDSVGAYNRWESTFQTIRRRAVVRVIPDQTGYLIDVEVHKELEDLPRPEHSTAGASSFRNDSSLPSRIAESVSRTELSGYWIPIGRDATLEQKLSADIKACLDGGAVQ